MDHPEAAGTDPLDDLRAGYGSLWDISKEPRRWRDREPRYIAVARRPGINPHCVITVDPAELAEALADGGQR